MLNYGEALKYQREVAGLSQSALAKATGLKQQMLSWWEAGRGLPNIDFCVQLADFYGITVDELIGRDSGGTARGAKYHIGTLNNNGGKIDMK